MSATLKNFTGSFILFKEGNLQKNNKKLKVHHCKIVSYK